MVSAWRWAPARSGASTITRTRGSVPEARSSTRPVRPSSRLDASRRRRRPPGRRPPQPCRRRATLSSTWGSRVTTPARSARRPSGRGHLAQQLQRREQAVPVVFHAAARRAPTARRRASTHRSRMASSTYRSPTAVVTSVSPRSSRARCSPRLLMTVATTVSSCSSPRDLMRQGQHGEDLVPVDHGAGVVHRQAAVGVPVERHTRRRRPRRGPPAAAAPGGSSRMPSLMFSPSGSAPITCTVAPAVRNAVGAATDAAPWAQSTTTRQTCERLPAGQGRHAVGGVDLGGAGVATDPTDAGTDGPLPGPADQLGDRVLDVVGELAAEAVEELDAVVRHRVVRGGDHHRRGRRPARLATRCARPGVGSTPASSTSHAGTGQACAHRGGEELARGPGVAGRPGPGAASPSPAVPPRGRGPPPPTGSAPARR